MCFELHDAGLGLALLLAGSVVAAVLLQVAFFARIGDPARDLGAGRAFEVLQLRDEAVVGLLGQPDGGALSSRLRHVVAPCLGHRYSPVRSQRARRRGRVGRCGARGETTKVYQLERPCPNRYTIQWQLLTVAPAVASRSVRHATVAEAGHPGPSPQESSPPDRPRSPCDSAAPDGLHRAASPSSRTVGRRSRPRPRASRSTSNELRLSAHIRVGVLPGGPPQPTSPMRRQATTATTSRRWAGWARRTVRP